MKFNKTFYALILLFSLASCKEEQNTSNKQTVVSTFYFIRHAEKDRSDPSNADPELNQEGLGRAMHWAEILDEVEFDAIYITDYLRTEMTAAPISIKKEITVQYHNPQEVDIQRFKTDNMGKNVLVVGHSNTTPEFVNKMLGENKYYEMEDTDNGSLFIVQMVNEQVVSQRLHFNCNCPKDRQ